MSLSKKSNIKIRTKDITLDENVEFSHLNLSNELLLGLKQAGFHKPSPIQLKAIPLGKLGLDLVVQAKSGTGKTCVFSVIALESIILESRALQALILAPTREIALQIMEFMRKISRSIRRLKCHAFIGGQALNEDKQKLQWCHVAVGTPGRIYHLINEKLLKTDSIRLFVLDEADKLLASEFQKDINLIYSNLPENKQMIALSATYPPYIATFVTRYMRSATYVRLNTIDPSLRGIRQYFKIIPYSKFANIIFDSKIEQLINLFQTVKFTQAIVFTNFQMKAENLCQALVIKNWPTVFIAGNIDQSKRNEAIAQLRQFKCRILVSTDLTARGIDAENVDLIINMETPLDAETYMHRIGRAGRYGCEGCAISLVAEGEELNLFKEIIQRYSLRISEYGKDLNDILSQNEVNKDEDRVDDVTIQKVNISQKELLQSVNEFKQANRDFEQKKKLFKRRVNEGTVQDNEHYDSNDAFSNLFLSLSEIEQSIEVFKRTSRFECLNTVNLTKKSQTLGIDFKITNEIKEKRKELLKIFKPNEVAISSESENEESNAESHKISKEEPQEDTYYSNYCNRFSQFYFHYFSKFLKK